MHRHKPELDAWNKVLNDKKRTLSKYCSTAQNDVRTIVKAVSRGAQRENVIADARYRSRML